MKRTPLAALALVAALVTVLGAACDDEVDPDFAPPESTSPAPTDPTTSTTPEPQKLSPEETVRAWVDARNMTVQDGSSEAVYALSTDDCKTCRDSVEPVVEVYRQGGHYETEGWAVESAKPRPDFDHSHAVAVAVEYAAGRTFRDAEADPITYEAEKQLFVFELRREQGVWKVQKILYVS